MTGNTRKDVQDDIRKFLGERIFNATVDSVSGGLIKIIRLDQTDTDGQFYPAATGLAAAVAPGDLVLCVVAGGVVQVVAEIVIA